MFQRLDFDPVGFEDDTKCVNLKQSSLASIGFLDGLFDLVEVYM
jgi:hypothetical protein